MEKSSNSAMNLHNKKIKDLEKELLRSQTSLESEKQSISHTKSRIHDMQGLFSPSFQGIFH